MARGYDKFDVETLRRKTREHIATMRLKAQVHEAVCGVLKTFDGKVINKRMATAVDKVVKELPGNLSATWRNEFSWVSIKVWGNPDILPYTGGYDQMICYDNDKGRDGDGRFYYDYWAEKYEGKYGNATFNEHVARAEAALRTVDQKVAAYNDAVDAVEKAREALDGLATWS